MNRDKIFIVGGGPSLKGFDFSKLNGLDTIAVNMAALDVPNPTFCITADSNTFKRIQKGFFKEINTTWVLVTNPNHCSMKWKDGKFIHNDGFVYNLFSVNMVIQNSGVDGIGFTFKDFKTGYNSGFCAFQLAVLLGYKKIYLLGIDVNSAAPTHYHDKYHGRKIDIESLDKFYNNFVLALNIIKKDTDIEVVSCSNISRLNNIIPYIPFEKVIDSTMQHIPLFTKPIEQINTTPDFVEWTDDKCKKKLSILICTITERREILKRLLSILDRQKTEDIEILIESDNRQITIGQKRNKLLERAKGEYVSFIDDDDTVSEDYVSEILKAIETKPDCCGIEGMVFFINRKNVNKFVHSIQYKNWFTKEDIYYRCPNHLSPVKIELARRIMFEKINHGEDKIYSIKLLPLLKTEVYIKKPIYYYMAD